MKCHADERLTRRTRRGEFFFSLSSLSNYIIDIKAIWLLRFGYIWQSNGIYCTSVGCTLNRSTRRNRNRRSGKSKFRHQFIVSFNTNSLHLFFSSHAFCRRMHLVYIIAIFRQNIQKKVGDSLMERQETIYMGKMFDFVFMFNMFLFNINLAWFSMITGHWLSLVVAWEIR